MKGFRVLFLSLSVFFLAAGLAPAADFSADVVNTRQGEETRGKIYIQAGKIRMQTPDTEEYTVLRADKKVIWIVIPDEKTYIEIPSPQTPGSAEKMKGEVKRQFLGSETVNGHPAKKYEVHYLDKDTLHKAHQWVASDLNYPVKISAPDGSWTTEYQNIRVGPQADGLFEVPEGFDRVSKSAPPSSEPKPEANPPSKGK